MPISANGYRGEFDSAPAIRRLGRVDMRAFDVVIAGAILLFIAPLLLALAMFVVAQDGGPPLFAQVRLGRDGRVFKCLKFRTMVRNAEERLNAVLLTDPQARAEWNTTRKLRNDPRITSIGRFLRKSSLDELPQLINVIRGEMSLVGPRPIVQAEADRYGWRFRHYSSVRPGITGLWQVSGRSDVSYRCRVALDSLYVQNQSPRLYMAILLRTVPAVLMRSGSY